MSSLSEGHSTYTIFGGDVPWESKDWTDSDDRVRGGKSQSYLDCRKSKAIFKGTLDIKTLGGAGFASQRTTGEDKEWDLSGFDGLELAVDTKHSDLKKYTFVIKDKLLPRDPYSGREQSTISWEYEFDVSALESQLKDGKAFIFIPWQRFKATYRGKERKDVEKVDLRAIKSFSIMMRSFFGAQEGDFQLTLMSMTARKEANTPPASPKTFPRSTNVPSADDESISGGSLMKQVLGPSSERQSIWHWFLGKCGKL